LYAALCSIEMLLCAVKGLVWHFLVSFPGF